MDATKKTPSKFPKTILTHALAVLLGSLAAFAVILLAGNSQITAMPSTTAGAYDPLCLGWILFPEELDEADNSAPYSFDFHDGTVDIVTVGGDAISCKFEYVGEESFERAMVIYDYFGRDLELEYSVQPALHLRILGDGKPEQLDYWFAG